MSKAKSSIGLSELDLTFPTGASLACALVFAVLVVLFITVSSATADTILFNDLTDNVSITTISTRVTAISCGINSLFEFCDFTLAPPSSTATLLSPSAATFGIAEAGSTSASDEIAYGQIVGSQILTFNFFSDLDPGATIATCSPPITNCLVETGAVQTAFQLFWSNGTVDTIQFQSEVPELPSIILLAIGMALGAPLKIMKYRAKRFQRHSSELN